MTSRTTLYPILALIVASTACATPVTRDFDFAQQVEQRQRLQCPQSVDDVDGRSYRTVVIGEQCWFADNLATSKTRQGQDLVDTVVIDLEKFGRLYRHTHVTHPGGICPDGWHVPTDVEVQRLEAALGISADGLSAKGWRGDNQEAFRLKQTATAFSWTPEEKARVNDTGFSVLAAGEQVGFFTGADGLYAGMWTSTLAGDEAWVRYFFWNAASGNNGKIWRDIVDRERAYSVRCLLDAPSATGA